MEKPTCATCQFFTRPGAPRDMNYGVCARFPGPVNHHQGDWCGEHKPIQVETQIREPKRKP